MDEIIATRLLLVDEIIASRQRSAGHVGLLFKDRSAFSKPKNRAWISVIYHSIFDLGRCFFIAWGANQGETPKLGVDRREPVLPALQSPKVPCCKDTAEIW